MIPFNFRLLGFLRACHVLFFPSVSVTQYFCWVCSHIILGFLSLFYSFGHPWPVSFLGASLSHLILFLFSTFPWVFAKSFELPRPNYHILYFWVYWPLNQPHLLIHFFGAPSAHLCLLFTSYNSHGLITSFFGAPLGPFAFFGTLLLFYGPVYH